MVIDLHASLTQLLATMLACDAIVYAVELKKIVRIGAVLAFCFHYNEYCDGKVHARERDEKAQFLFKHSAEVQYNLCCIRKSILR